MNTSTLRTDSNEEGFLSKQLMHINCLEQLYPNNKYKVVPFVWRIQSIQPIQQRAFDVVIL